MKIKTIKQLKVKLWKVFAEYIKQRDRRKCFTCNKTILPGKGLHCGHFIPSAVCGYELRYDEENVHVQCYFCNINLGGYGSMYYKKMLECYGEGKVKKIFKKLEYHNKNKKAWKEKEYIDKIEYYSKKLKHNSYLHL